MFLPNWADIFLAYFAHSVVRWLFLLHPGRRTRYEQID
jgi:hypothetical protein